MPVTKTKPSKFIGADIECSGLYPNPKSKIYCVTYNIAGTVELTQNPLSIKALLEDPSICKIFHNAVFDCFWLWMVHGIVVRNIWCTRLMEQVLLGETLPRSNKDEETKKMLSSSLVYTLPRYGLPILENKEMGAAFATRNPSAPLTEAEKKYAKNDVKYLLQLQAFQEYRLRKLDLMRVAVLENKTVERVVAMRVRGIGFDKAIWKKIAARNQAAYNHILKRLPSAVSNWKSPAQVKKYFRSRGIPIESYEDIPDVAAKYNDPVLNKFVELQKLYKNVTTYGMGWFDDDIKGSTIDHDGRIRTDYEQIINTGRFASNHPNLQQIPRDGEHRAAFVPAKGKCFVIGDFSGQEIGIMAAASNEEVWIKAVLRRDDIHSLTASLLYTTEWRDATEKGCTFPKQCSCKGHKIMRQAAKTINFAIAYGAGPLKISISLKITQIQATALLARYKRVVPSLIRWLDKNAKESVKTRLSFSADPYRRRRVLRDPEEWMLTNIGKNNPVQSSGANQLKLSLISLPEDAPVVLLVHDEIVLECPIKEAKKWSKVLKGVMEEAAAYCTGVKGLIEVNPEIKYNLLKG